MTSKIGLNFFQKLKQYQTKNIDVILAYARLAIFYKRHMDALEEIDILLKQKPEYEDALVLKAEVLQRIGKSNYTLSLLSKIAVANNTSNNLLLYYAKSLSKHGAIWAWEVRFAR